jgi:hypothetical protein
MRWKWWAPKYEAPLDQTGAATSYPEQAGAYPQWNAATMRFPAYNAPLMTPLQQLRASDVPGRRRGGGIF